MTEFRNQSTQPIAVQSVYVVHVVWPSDNPVTGTVRPGGKIRFLHAPKKLLLTTGGCDYAYVMPAEGLSNRIGAVNQVDVANDMRLYLERMLRQDGRWVKAPRESQPAGWPVAPMSRTCR